MTVWDLIEKRNQLKWEITKLDAAVIRLSDGFCDNDLAKQIILDEIEDRTERVNLIEHQLRQIEIE